MHFYVLCDRCNVLACSYSGSTCGVVTQNSNGEKVFLSINIQLNYSESKKGLHLFPIIVNISDNYVLNLLMLLRPVSLDSHHQCVESQG